MKKMKSVFAVLCAAFSGLFLASVFAGEDKTSTHVTQEALTTSPSPTLPKFIDHRDYPAADNPTNLASGDLNGDGIADLVVPSFQSNNISVLLGKANGSFQDFPFRLWRSRKFQKGTGPRRLRGFCITETPFTT